MTNLPHDASLGVGIAPPLTQLTVAGFYLFVEGAITLCMMSKGLVPLGCSELQTALITAANGKPLT